MDDGKLLDDWMMVSYSKYHPTFRQHVKKIYCYEKITITNVDQIKPKIEELSEKVGGIWRCKFCGKTTASQKKNELSTHIESHFEGVNYHCTICNRTCKTRTALRGHMYREHKAVPLK